MPLLTIMQLVVHGADPEAATCIDPTVVEPVVEALLDAGQQRRLARGPGKTLEFEVQREQVGAVVDQGLAAQKRRLEAMDLVPASCGVERLQFRAFDIEPP
jgi:uncharacterized protein (DUF362 family)